MYKAYYVLRQDLNMTTAKLAIQVGHGTDMIHAFCGFDTYMLWKSQDRRKIILSIKTEKKLNNLIALLVMVGLMKTMYVLPSTGLRHLSLKT